MGIVTRVFPVFVLGLMGLINLARGAVHAFAPDGGAHSIAGLDLGADPRTVLSLFATLGLAQMAKGAFQLLVAARFRGLTALFLAMQATDTLLALANLYAWRPLPVSVPGQPFNLVLFAVQALALIAALAARREPAKPM